MNFAFSEEQEMLRATVRSFLDDKAPSATVRQLMESESGFDRGLWEETANMGWQAMHVPEEYGGAGFGHLEVNIVLEEMGKSLYPSPFFSTVVLGANTLLVGGSSEQKKEHLTAIASGETRVALATVEESGRWEPDAVDTVATADGGDFLLDGVKSFVLDGHTADTLIVSARTPAGITLFMVDGDAPGVTRHRLETMDMTRKQALVELSGVRVPATAMLGSDGGAVSILHEVMTLAIVSLACEQVGGASTCLDMAVEYAKVRKQFGRPIGSFQAIKHKCADMLVAVESAKSAAYYASWAASAGEKDELALVAPLAKSFCSEAYFDVAAENIQVHGGIGFTWEHDAHLYFKRAKSSQLLFGSPAYHRQVLADRLGI